jgi:hypothetical protein
MFGKLKDKAVEKMLEKQLGNVPPAQKEMVMKAVQENPDFFKKIAEEIKAEEKSGKSQMVASMSVMRKYQGELQKIMLKSQK